MKPLILLDVDTGYDDAVAIILSIQLEIKKQVNLLGITTVSGNVPVNRTYINSVSVCDEVLDINNVNVYSGCTKPLVRKAYHAFGVHGESGLDGVNFQKKVDAPINASDLSSTSELSEILPDAVRFIVSMVNAYPGEITIFATAPLTNIATAIKADKSIGKKIKQIILMGGGIEHGNVTPAAEFNMFSDPEAADVVLSSSIPITMIPLETTLKLQVTESIINKTVSITNRAASLCGEILSCYVEKYQEYCGKYPAAHDIATIMYFLYPELFTVKKASVKVITENSDFAGKTVMDFSDNKITVTTDVDVDSFWSLFTRCLK